MRAFGGLVAEARARLWEAAAPLDGTGMDALLVKEKRPRMAVFDSLLTLAGIMALPLGGAVAVSGGRFSTIAFAVFAGAAATGALKGAWLVTKTGMMSDGGAEASSTEKAVASWAPGVLAAAGACSAGGAWLAGAANPAALAAGAILSALGAASVGCMGSWTFTLARKTQGKAWAVGELAEWRDTAVSTREARLREAERLRIGASTRPASNKARPGARGRV